MGGKRLNFPKRQKYVAPNPESKTEEKPVTEEEHKARLDKLKELGLIK